MKTARPEFRFGYGRFRGKTLKEAARMDPRHIENMALQSGAKRDWVNLLFDALDTTGYDPRGRR